MDVIDYTNRSITVKQVADFSNLSTATVSRVLNGARNVRPATRQRVLEAVQALGYTGNHAARALRSRRTNTFGVIFPYIASGFFSEVLIGMNEVASQRGIHLNVGFAHGEHDQEQLVSQYLQDGRVDALLLMNLSMPEAFIEQMVQSGTPIVLLDRPAASAAVPSVVVDNVGGAKAAMRHLLACGHERIAVIRGPQASFDSQQRLVGCWAALTAAQRELEPDLLWAGDFTEPSGQAAVSAWLEAGRELPDAIFALNDTMALGVRAVLDAAGIRIPEDVALVGFDDVEPARHVGLTTVRSPMMEMGRTALRMAVAAAEGEGEGTAGRPAAHQVLDTELIVRQTCGWRHRQGPADG